MPMELGTRGRKHFKLIGIKVKSHDCFRPQIEKEILMTTSWTPTPVFGTKTETKIPNELRECLVQGL